MATNTLTDHERPATGLEARGANGVKRAACDRKDGLAGRGGSPDADLARSAARALARSVLHPEQIRIEVDDGWVILDGEVKRPVRRAAAEHAVRWLRGVKGVFNRITIGPRLVAKDLRTRIGQAVEGNAEVESGSIRITARDLTVTLRGSVGSWEEWEEADRVAWSAPGVYDVVNELIVNP